HASLYFVSDQEDFKLIADLTQTRPEVVGRNDGTSFALHWFHNHRRNVVANFAGDTQLLLDRIGVTIGNVIDVIVEREHRMTKHRFSSEGERACGFAVEATHSGNETA